MGTPSTCDALLEKKVHAINLSIISTLLGRNPQMKLTPADVHFLRPVDRAPQRRYHIPLPTHLLVYPISICSS